VFSFHISRIILSTFHLPASKAPDFSRTPYRLQPNNAIQALMRQNNAIQALMRQNNAIQALMRQNNAIKALSRLRQNNSV
jgi:hypothetical protein